MAPSNLRRGTMATRVAQGCFEILEFRMWPESLTPNRNTRRSAGRCRATRRGASRPGRCGGTSKIAAIESRFRWLLSSSRYSRAVFPVDVVECFIGFMWLIRSGCQAIDASTPEQVRELLAGVEHPRLHRALRDPDDRAGLFHRLLVIVDEVDDLAVRRR